MKNDYPYNVNADHWVLWTDNQIKNPKLILNNIIPNITYKYYENPEHLKSIPEIKHYHIFIQNT